MSTGSKITRLKFTVMVVVLLVMGSVGAISQSDAHIAPVDSPDTTTPLLQTQNETAYLPIVNNRYPIPPTVFGVQIKDDYVDTTIDKAGQANVSWVRYNGIIWSQIEKQPGAREWSAISSVNEELRTLAEYDDVTPLVIVRSTPDWAQKVAGSYCGAIAEQSFDEFADFMYDMVSRYSKPPYNVKYWELWNEPDISPEFVSPHSGFGCWGDKDDPYYGGRYYAEMLKHAYGAIKLADPGATVVLGGLLLDCDPTHNTSCTAGKFLEGVLLNNGDNYLDAIGYHGHPVWNATETDWDLSYPKWKHRGGLVLGKLDFIRNVMTTYGVDKPVMMTEGGLLCHPSTNCPGTELRDDQANYAVRLYIRAWANDLDSAIWFTLNGPGWRKGGLLDGNQAPRPAYYTVQFLTGLLADAKYNKQLSGGALEGYEFADDSATYRVYWTNDGSTVSVPQPAGTTALYDKFGNSLLLPSGDISVGFQPIIVKVE